MYVHWGNRSFRGTSLRGLLLPHLQSPLMLYCRYNRWEWSKPGAVRGVIFEGRLLLLRVGGGLRSMTLIPVSQAYVDEKAYRV